MVWVAAGAAQGSWAKTVTCSTHAAPVALSISTAAFASHERIPWAGMYMYLCPCFSAHAISKLYLRPGFHRPFGLQQHRYV